MIYNKVINSKYNNKLKINKLMFYDENFKEKNTYSVGGVMEKQNEEIERLLQEESLKKARKHLADRGFVRKV
jgi:hypothetical protein